MWRLLFVLSTLLPVGLWELHAVGFFPWWFQAAPIWPWFVVLLCLEVDWRRTATAFAGVSIWMALLPIGTVLRIALFLLCIIGAYGLLRVWLSHRSVWSALALVWLGRIVMVGTDLARYWWQDAWGFVDWDLFLRLNLTRFAWDGILVMVGLRCALWLRKRLQPYVPLSLRPL